MKQRFPDLVPRAITAYSRLSVGPDLNEGIAMMIATDLVPDFLQDRELLLHWHRAGFPAVLLNPKHHEEAFSKTPRLLHFSRRCAMTARLLS